MGNGDGENTQVVFGTPVDVPDEDEEVHKKLPVQDQIVTDERGRRRFHGAFTGGFSAGYFNSVGTKQGWAPSSFRSSRKEKHESDSSKTHQDVLQFMDEEDMEAFGIAPQQVRSTKTYQNEQASAPDDFPEKQNLTAEESKAIAHLSSLLQVTKDTIGIRLLKLMGWREGQGIGARLTARQQAKAFGFDDDEVDEHAVHMGISFAPRDIKSRQFKPKDNYFGIEYQGIKAQDFNLGAGKATLGAGFGVGVFEEEDDDIYETDDRSQYTRTMDESFEFPKHKSFRSHGSEQSRYPAIKQGLQSNSTFYLDGFQSAPRKFIIQKYPTPNVPKDYDPKHRQKRASTSTSTFVPQPPRETLTSRDRAVILGEVPLLPPKVADSKPQQQQQSQVKVTAADAARQQHPLSKVMAMRFTLPQGPASESLTEEEKIKAKRQEDDSLHAACNGMFGRLTRKVYEWHPHRILCKRLSIPDPYPRSGLVGIAVQEPASTRSNTRWGPVAAFESTTAGLRKGPTIDTSKPLPKDDKIAEELLHKAVARHHDGKSDKENLASSGGHEEDVEPLPERPPLDLFKAIFSGSDDDDDDDDDDGDGDGEDGDGKKLESGNNSNENAVTLSKSNGYYNQGKANLSAVPENFVAVHQQSLDENPSELPARTTSSPAHSYSVQHDLSSSKHYASSSSRSVERKDDTSISQSTEKSEKLKSYTFSKKDTFIDDKHVNAHKQSHSKTVLRKDEPALQTKSQQTPRLSLARVHPLAVRATQHPTPSADVNKLDFHRLEAKVGEKEFEWVEAVSDEVRQPSTIKQHKKRSHKKKEKKEKKDKKSKKKYKDGQDQHKKRKKEKRKRKALGSSSSDASSYDDETDNLSRKQRETSYKTGLQEAPLPSSLSEQQFTQQTSGSVGEAITPKQHNRPRAIDFF